MFPAGKNLRCPRVHRVQHVGLDTLHTNIARGLDARVAQGPSCVLQRAVLLQIGAERPPHNLKGDQMKSAKEGIGSL